MAKQYNKNKKARAYLDCLREERGIWLLFKARDIIGGV